MANIDLFIKKIKSGYWTEGNEWEFDWYIDCFFVEAMAYRSNPVKIGYMQSILGDSFLSFKYADLIQKEFDGFLLDSAKCSKLIKNQNNILNRARNMLLGMGQGKFSSSEYKEIQLDLSLLMASVSVEFDELMPDVIAKISSDTGISEEKISAYIIERSSRTKLNESNLELLKIYKGNIKAFENANFEYLKLRDDVKVLVDRHTEKYGWLNTGERGSKSWTGPEFCEHLNQLIQKKWDGNIRSEMTINSNHLDTVNSLISINHNDNTAADLQVELDYLFQEHLKGRLGEYYIESILENLTYEEILDIVSNPKMIKKYKIRANNQLRVAWPENGTVNIHYFNSKKEFAKVANFVLKDVLLSETIKGVVACRGTAKGVVRLIEKQKDIYDFKEGEILVASKTQPSYVVIMNKAAAIVTDVGGVTSHAAIISREFNIPCIVATKNATKLLKNGDLVFVDANNGTVRKIVNAKV